MTLENFFLSYHTRMNLTFLLHHKILIHSNKIQLNEYNINNKYFNIIVCLYDRLTSSIEFSRRKFYFLPSTIRKLIE